MIIACDEQNLAVLCSKRDRKGEDELYTRYAARLYALCLRYCNNQDEAMDMVQETFIKALDNISSFTYKGNGSLYSWIKRIAINLAVNKIKRQKIRFVPFDHLKVDAVDDPSCDTVLSIPESSLLKIISELPERERMIFNMYCIDGYSHKDIATALNITEKGSASILSKAKAQLRVKITDYIKQTDSR